MTLYVLDMGVTPTTNYGDNETVCETGSFGANVRLTSLSIRFESTGTWNGKVVVYDNTSALLASSAVQSLTVSSTSTYYTVPLISPLLLTAGTTYRIGYWTGTSGVYPGIATNGSSAAIASSPAGYTWTPTGVYQLCASSDSFPSNTLGYRSAQKMNLDSDMNPPNAPTGVSVTNTPVTFGVAPNITWAHNDTEGSAQAQYQIRWRKI